MWDLRMDHVWLEHLSDLAERVNSGPAIVPEPSASPKISASVTLTSQFGSTEQDIGQGGSYIPVGALLSPKLHPCGYPEMDILVLREKKYKRIRTCQYNDNVRVYLRAEDVDRKELPQSSTRSKQALKVVMSMIDRSPEAWEGRQLARSPATTTSDGAEDDSLWYIFNTLQDPDPRPETIEDDISRQAVEDLLCDSYLPVVPGLKTRLYPYQRRSAAAMVQRETQPSLVLDPRLEACQSPTGVEYYYDKEDGSVFREKRLYSEALGGRFLSFSRCIRATKCKAVKIIL